MTPEEAESILRHAEELPRRVRRYVLEGGKRCVWTCAFCKTSTAAESWEEAEANITAYTEKYPSVVVGDCDHSIIVQYQMVPVPPADFS